MSERLSKPEIVTISPKKLIGMKKRMSHSANKTVELWQTFMPRRKEIQNNVDSNFISMQVYDPSMDFKNFTPFTEFEKWAAVEVADFTTVPSAMETYELAGGLYAVFIYKGTPETFKDSFFYIYQTWLPQSGYELDNREHFEVLGENYKRNDPDSEEEIWVPLRAK